jgi:ABC-type multidrug transport system ATPase subunit
MSMGGQFENNVPQLDSDAGIYLLEFYQQLMSENIASRETVAWDSGDMRASFIGGNAAQALIGDPQLIIVDEPTAGLDPAERNRFHNILSEIGENTVVLLSTHIVDDVRDLCTNMGIINRGNILLTGNPLEIINTLRGSIWEKLIEKKELSDYEKNYNVIYSRLYAGKVIIHVFDTEKPAPSFVEADPTLEDVYFHELKSTDRDQG